MALWNWTLLNTLILLVQSEGLISYQHNKYFTNNSLARSQNNSQVAPVKWRKWSVKTSAPTITVHSGIWPAGPVLSGSNRSGSSIIFQLYGEDWELTLRNSLKLLTSSCLESKVTVILFSVSILRTDYLILPTSWL